MPSFLISKLKVIPLTTEPDNRIVAYWLFFCCFMIAVMVLVGGLTRLTESGLSIVEWKPVSGVVPPLTEQAWQEEFSKYRQSPEYIKKNHGMELADFKKIFLWEYSHRLLGRSIGVVFFLPFVYFLVTKRISRIYAGKFLTIFLLGGLQGVIGWYMVKSGLVDRPDVSQYRLTLHLGTAFLLYAMVLWTAFSILRPKEVVPQEQLALPCWFRNMAIVILVLVMVQVLAGGFVAGLDAGLVYNSFPTMNGHYIPDGLLIMQPWYINFFENVTTVQFTHRMLAIATASVIALFWWLMQRSIPVRSSLNMRERNYIHAMLVILVLQFSLGVATLIYAVPISLASAHQMGALALFTLAVIVSHILVHKK